MIFQEMESLDRVEAVIAFEEIFGAELPDDDCDKMDSPREVVNWLERHLTKQRPSKQAAAWLRKLAGAHNNPALAEGLDGTWRREQIAAIRPRNPQAVSILDRSCCNIASRLGF